jgi:hypothetical protein
MTVTTAMMTMMTTTHLLVPLKAKAKTTRTTAPTLLLVPVLKTKVKVKSPTLLLVPVLKTKVKVKSAGVTSFYRDGIVGPTTRTTRRRLKAKP